MKAMGISRNSHRFLTSHKAFGFVGVFAWKDGSEGILPVPDGEAQTPVIRRFFFAGRGGRLSAQGFVKVLSK